MKRVRAAIKRYKWDALDGLRKGLEKGDSWAVTLWFHYFYGKPAEKLEHSGAEGEAISIIINRTVKPEGE